MTKENENIRERFRRSDALIVKKLFEYIPVMIITNLCSLLLISVDGLVVGNLVGENALASVSIFRPITVLIGVASVLVATGIGTTLSLCMGENDHKRLAVVKATSKLIMIISAILVLVLGFPAVLLFISSYGLSPEMTELTREYAIGVMISMPFGLISTVGVYQLQIVGEMKTIMRLSILEGIVNVILDLLFVGVLHMGVAGAGFGTAGANIVRCTLSLIIITKKTSLFDSHGVKASVGEVKAILKSGLPESAESLMMAIKGYVMIRIIISAFGEQGGTIDAVCSFAFNLALILAGSVQDSMRPLAGIMAGGKDWKGLRSLMKQGFLSNAVIVGAITAVCCIFPRLFYIIHGVEPIPDGGLQSLQIISICFVFKGMNALFRLNDSCRKDVYSSSIMTVVWSVALPILAYVLIKMFSGPFLWLSYTVIELSLMGFNLLRYRKRISKDKQEETVGLLYLSVSPEEAVEASRAIRRYADDHGFDKKISYRISLCMEEMVSYAVASQKNSVIKTQIVIRFFESGAVFEMLDNGKCIALDRDSEIQELITDNYGLVKKLAKSVEYQYLLNMNYTVFTF